MLLPGNVWLVGHALRSQAHPCALPTDASPETKVPEPSKPSSKPAAPPRQPHGLPQVDRPTREARVKAAPVPWRERWTGMLTSTIVHALVVIVLGLLLPLEIRRQGRPMLQV